MNNQQPVNPKFFKAMNHHGMTFEEAEKNLLNMMQQRKELGLSTDGVLIDATVNRIQ